MELTHKKYCYPGSNSTFYTVTWNPHQIDVTSDEITEWSVKTFGPCGYKEDEGRIRWTNDIESGSITFLHEEDLTMFKLRWE